MGTRYQSQATSGYNASPPPDDGTQVASNLVTWASVKTKLADVLKTFGEAINTALVSALDLSARAISTPDTAVASDHWKTLQVTGNTTITLSSAASMGAGYEVGVFNAGVGVVTVTPGAAADTINGVSASVTVSIKGTKIFRTNQALTGYNVVGGYDPQTVTASTSVVTPLVGTDSATDFALKTGGTNKWVVRGVADADEGALSPNADLGSELGMTSKRIKQVFTPIIDTGTTGSGALKTNNGTTVLTWDNNGGVAWGTGVANRGTITKRKTADESVTSSTALQDDDHLTFAIAANEEWNVTYFINAGAAANLTGIKLAVTVPSGATLDTQGYFLATSEDGFGRSTVSGTASLNIATASTATNIYVGATAWVLNGATPGSVTLQWAQGTSNGTALTFRKGSYLTAVRVA